MVSEVQHLNCQTRHLIVWYRLTFAQLDSSLRKKLSSGWTTQNWRLFSWTVKLFIPYICIYMLFLARLFPGFFACLLERPSYILPKDNGDDRWMVTVTQLVRTSLCSWDVCSEFMMSYWIMVILDNWSFFQVTYSQLYQNHWCLYWLFTWYYEAF